jgi:6-pyruvoyltetrahydropterin/6-carboxytetrahydropterin synthase
MYQVKVEARFSASHQVRMYDDELEALHGHDWRVEAVFRGPTLDRIGLLVDFVAAEKALRAVAAQLHHVHLNEAMLLQGLNPTAEHVAQRIFEELRERMPEAPLAAVYVHEAPGCTAAYLADVAAPLV